MSEKLSVGPPNSATEKNDVAGTQKSGMAGFIHKLELKYDPLTPSFQ